MRILDKDRYDLDYDQVFLGTSFGVALKKRENYTSTLPGDNYLFYILVEDDETWFVQEHQPSSAFWLRDLSPQIQEALAWVNAQ